MNSMANHSAAVRVICAGPSGESFVLFVSLWCSSAAGREGWIAVPHRSSRPLPPPRNNDKNAIPACRVPCPHAIRHGAGSSGSSRDLRHRKARNVRRRSMPTSPTCLRGAWSMAPGQRRIGAPTPRMSFTSRITRLFCCWAGIATSFGKCWRAKFATAYTITALCQSLIADMP